jgi:hypothetical protein
MKDEGFETACPAIGKKITMDCCPMIKPRGNDLRGSNKPNRTLIKI